MEKAIHFGEIVQGVKYPLKLTREVYGTINNRNSFSKTDLFKPQITFNPDVYVDESCKIYTDEWCRKHLKRALENYDLNMEFFASLSNDEFENQIQLLDDFGFSHIQNLIEVDRVSGMYVMVLSQYKQMYIGRSNNIRNRIKTHWGVKKQFDRLIFGTVNTSRISVDSFRALDTTDILVAPFFAENDEQDIVSQIDSRFLLNRIAGGLISKNNISFEQFATTLQLRAREMKGNKP